MNTAWISASLAAMALLAFQAGAGDTPFDEPLLGSRLEQRAPTGSVPPPGKPALAPALPGEQHYLAEPGGQMDQAAVSEVLEHFRQAYQQAGGPRMAVYFNRELSDEVREWIPGTQHQVTVSQAHAASFSSLNTGPVSAQSSATGTLESRSRHYTGASDSRPELREGWQWQFEDAIASTLLDGGANIVDRAVIFRQMARQAPQSAGMDGTMSTIVNEISALDEYADVLIEMKVTRSATDYGHDFRAVARNVQTGQIIGTAFVNGNQIRQGGAAAAASGYAMRNDHYPTLEQVSRELTLGLMRSLSGHWMRSKDS